MDVLTVAAKKRLATKKPPHDGKHNIQYWQAQRDHGDRHGDHSRRLLGTDQCHGAKHKANEKAAGVSQEYGCWVEVETQESQNGSSQCNRETRDQGTRDN